jgi:hypothetical protein
MRRFQPEMPPRAVIGATHRRHSADPAIDLTIHASEVSDDATFVLLVHRYKI